MLGSERSTACPERKSGSTFKLQRSIEEKRHRVMRSDHAELRVGRSRDADVNYAARRVLNVKWWAILFVFPDSNDKPFCPAGGWESRPGFDRLFENIEGRGAIV